MRGDRHSHSENSAGSAIEVGRAVDVAVVATAYGRPEVLGVVPVNVPEPGYGEVTVRLRAAGVNPIDYKLYSGELGEEPGRLPLRLGGEGAGQVSAVGPGSTLQVGDDVIVAAQDPAVDLLGCYATAVTVPASRVVPKPGALSWEESAGLLMCGATAVHAVTVAKLGVGETVLVHGVAGGVGRAVAQLAALAGATVLGTAAVHRHDQLRALGIVPLAYGPGLRDRLRAMSRVDAAIDTAGTDEAIDASLEVVDDPDRVVTLAAYTYGASRGVHVLGGAPGATDAGMVTRDRARSRLVQLASHGHYQVPVVATYPLTDVPAAHELARQGHAGGKIILSI